VKITLSQYKKIAKKVAGVCVAVFMTTSFGVSAQINTDQVINIGRNAYYFEDYLMAIQYFNQAIKAKPYLAKPYLYRAIAKLNLDDFVGAAADASKAIELNEFITDAYEVRGIARQNLGDNGGAVEDYDHAIKLLPRNRQLLFNKAIAQVDNKDYSGADSTFTEVLTYYPRFENGYLGRARLKLATADTVAALTDINKALELNDKSYNGYAMRADIAIHQGVDRYKDAIQDINEAIKLQPRSVGLYINRAYLNYSLNDYFAAMSDYDYALSLEPYNRTALFNRGLLEAEVNANDRALEDFNKVLSLEPTNLHARYNRALILAQKRRYNEALDDAQYIVNAFPDYPTGYYLRSQFYREKGDAKSSQREYEKAMAISKRLRPDKQGNVAGERRDIDEKTFNDPAEEAKRQFASLLTVDDNTDIREEYNNSTIRGKIQDRNLNVEIEPMIELSYYSSPDELGKDTYYMKEVDDINATRSLRMVVVVTNRVPVIRDQDVIDAHFRSIDDYNSYLSTHTPRTIDYVGRALDLMSVHNYDAALADLDRAVALTPDYALSYILRGQVRYKLIQLNNSTGQSVSDKHTMDPMTRNQLERKNLELIDNDLAQALKLSPTNPYVWYNRANIAAQSGDYDTAIRFYDNALSIKSDFGEAYYNRGYVNLKIGNRSAGIADLSKAGELGVASAYNLIKRVSN
jgi:tetratricopeptide (TPR) repeat protein